MSCNTLQLQQQLQLQMLLLLLLLQQDGGVGHNWQCKLHMASRSCRRRCHRHRQLKSHFADTQRNLLLIRVFHGKPVGFLLGNS